MHQHSFSRVRFFQRLAHGFGADRAASSCSVQPAPAVRYRPESGGPLPGRPLPRAAVDLLPASQGCLFPPQGRRTRPTVASSGPELFPHPSSPRTRLSSLSSIIRAWVCLYAAARPRDTSPFSFCCSSTLSLTRYLFAGASSQHHLTHRTLPLWLIIYHSKAVATASFVRI